MALSGESAENVQKTMVNIRDTKFWEREDKYDFSYIIMRPQHRDYKGYENLKNGKIWSEKDVDGFLYFWSRLREDFKERLLLLEYMICKRDMLENPCYDEFRAITGYNEKARQLFDCLYWKIRHFYLGDGPKSPEFRGLVQLLFECALKGASCGDRFVPPLPWTVVTAENELSQALCDFQIPLQFDFMRFAVEVIHLYGYRKFPKVTPKQSARFFGALAVIVPHWRQADRDFLVEAMKSNGASREGSYVQRQLRVLGNEKFKHIIFGKERHCNNCQRSSFDVRLCGKCEKKKIHPRARYCSKECQVSDWHHHKRQVHKHHHKRQVHKGLKLDDGVM